ncbi:PREDICTED: DUF724 domain-containing protein 1-like [Tarenaya hassleriana]|uniref:DUF724 domain-containing protein 1-like n=1 Tax=Tarenaya hassleriana TaxID=28532 RepID=UPI0008FD8A47|nr:PREDICTED: DUF724 domain-containing protein 1-like [Tarenaya hassleriana]
MCYLDIQEGFSGGSLCDDGKMRFVVDQIAIQTGPKNHFQKNLFLVRGREKKPKSDFGGKKRKTLNLKSNPSASALPAIFFFASLSLVPLLRGRDSRNLSPTKQGKKKPKLLMSARSDRTGRSSHLKRGSAVEISSDEHGFRGSWYPATVVRQFSDKNPAKYQVEYTTLFSDKEGKKRLREIVELGQIRPPPPREKERDFAVEEEVDAHYNDGWWEGHVTEVLGDGEFNVFFRSSREQIRFRKDDIRLHREWVDGAWMPPLEEDEEVEEEDDDEDEQEENNLSKIDPDIVKAIVKQELSRDTLVEVSSEEEGFEGSWFVARVVEPIGEDKYLVEYLDLREENGVQLLKEEADILHIRPPPPPSSDGDKDFELGDKVDAFYNDGWWEGIITEILKDGRFGVFFKHPREMIRFGRQGLRFHKDWINGNWLLPPKGGEKKKAEKVSRNGKVSAGKATGLQEFRVRSVIEVSIEEEGFEDSWFLAKIIEARGKGKYLVEYEKIKAEDCKEPLREEVDVLHMRHQPPETLMVEGFKKFEKVEAFYNDGWWVGEISKVLTESKYLVHFKNTQASLKFDHSQLRLHQEWVNGRWIRPSR